MTWQEVTIGTLANVVGGGTPSTRIPEYWAGDIPWFTPAEIPETGAGVVTRSKRSITREGLAKSAAKLLPAGTVLVTSRASIGNCAIAGVPVTTNQGFASLIPKDFRSTRYLYYWVQQNRGKLLSRAAGSTFLEISAPKVREIELLAPSAGEQERIGVALSDADDLIATLERLIAKKQAIKQGMMQQLLTGRTRLPGFEGEWTVTPVGSLARVTGGGTPSTGVSSYWGGGIPWFTPAEISSGGAGLVATSERTITQDGLANSAATLLPEGSVLVTSRASIGNCAVAAVPVATNQGFTSMIPRDRRSTWFLYYWVQQYRAEFESRSAGSTFLEISASKVAAIPLAAPGLPEQQAIGEVLRDADTELDALKSRLVKARAIKTGMMQQLLTGRVRLPVEAAS